jgi:hypothetical protein
LAIEVATPMPLWRGSGVAELARFPLSEWARVVEVNRRWFLGLLLYAATENSKNRCHPPKPGANFREL